jgi:HK97 family phage portal protein
MVETMAKTPTETIGNDFASYVNRGYLDNGIVFAAITARLTLFAQGEPRMINRNEDVRDLPPRLASVLESPWPNGSTSEMLARIEQDTSLAGNYYLYRATPDQWQRLRPDWVDIVLDGAGKEVVGYLYWDGGRMKGKPPVPLTVDEVAHGNPYPDPLRAFRGTSWLNSVAREVMADTSMTNHKLKYFDNAATPNMLVTVEGTLSTQSRETFRDALNAKFGGWRNAWKTLVLEEGADAKIIGSNLGELAFGDTQAAGENRIAVASQVPSVVLGIREGAEQATYSNYEQALQHFANFTIQYLWTHAAATIGTLLPIPAGWSLYFDPTNIPALQTDVQQDATIAEIQANTIRELIDAGFDPASVVDAVATGDMSGLQHSGLVSDQLQDQAESGDVVSLLSGQ